MAKEALRLRAKTRMVAYPAGDGVEPRVLEAGSLVEADDYFVSLHPDQFEPEVQPEPVIPVAEEKK